MKRMTSGSVAVALALAVWASPAVAQQYWWDLGVNVGGSLFTSMVGADEGFTGGDAKFATGVSLGSQLTIWPWSRVGIRANGQFADRALEGDNEIYSNVNLWGATGDLMLRFKAPNETWQGSETIPYIALGAGLKWVNPAGDPTVCYDTSRNQFWSCTPLSSGTGANQALGEWKESITALIGIGADFRFSPRWLFRLEANDRIFKPQVQEVASFLGGNIYDVPDGEENLSKLVHEIGLQAGLHVVFGMRGPAAVAAPPPPPQQPPPQQQAPPPPPQQPAPPPPPREDQISVCVVDPGASGGLRMQSAVFRHASSDTVVVSGDQTTPLRQTVGNVNTAANADWYVRGTPFVLAMGRAREEFVTYGQPSMMQSGIVYIGMANNHAVYANASDVSAFQSQLAAAVQQRNGDLAGALGANNSLRTSFDRVNTIFVPMTVIGCRFQGLQRQEPVRKDER
ncbi:MAG: outer membrane beta-barrel protein [Gemmatimonadetes bacterium]|nr:outer membrane beta-barrel protein [Gemmatimonadota bacterium]